MTSEAIGGSTAVAEPTAGEHQPYVGDRMVLPEFTWSAVFMGAVLGIIFGASSLYLVLKVGMTVSASIPVAVLSITLFRLFSRMFGIRRATILENNIVQTAGSAGEAIAAGVGVTMPALMLLGFEMEVGRVLVVSILGGALGILMMIPLRRSFIVKQHGSLIYPEGTACADVLIVGEQGGASAQTVFTGFGIGFVYQFFSQGARFWKEVVARPLAWFHGAVPAIEVNPALLGVGYIIGRRIACTMAAGGIMASFVLIPAIRFFGDGLPKPLYPGMKAIAQLSEEELAKTYVLYIGAGAVAAGGIICVFRALPLIVSSIRAGLRDVRSLQRGGQTVGSIPRTDRDISLRVVGIGTLVLLVLIWATLPLGTLFGWVNFLGAVLIMLFGALFVTVSSRLVGEIGSTSNPLSGMTVATLLLTCLIFLALGWTDPPHRLVALSVAAVVCIAASNAGATSQDLKTGFLVGATPRYQQLAILVGSTSSALAVGWILIVLNQASTVYSSRNMPHFVMPLDVAELIDMESAPGDDAMYHVWRPALGNPQNVPEGKYLVDDQGQPRYRVDPGINGVVNRRDDGTEVHKFKAPKARLMGMITQGILTQKLPWTLVLLGVSITIVLELCNVSALPFAVGVYLPLSSSAPIFFGGMIRWAVDCRNRRANGQSSPDDSDMSPGVLLSTGYIAGGAICGVLLAFLSFSEEIPKKLGAWQFRHATVTANAPLDEQFMCAAERELGIGETATGQQQEDLKRLAAEIAELNGELPYLATRVPDGLVLQLPKNETFSSKEETTLGEVARQALKTPEKASLLFDLNHDRLQLPDRLNVGTELRIPARNWPALTAFSVLGVVLIAVGLGWPIRTGGGCR
ncbi:MAG: oligopeptide transporter, OPT family [Thermoguttaceae bacterium]|jgi:putative OPT family oligopeptide transporter